MDCRTSKVLLVPMFSLRERFHQAACFPEASAASALWAQSLSLLKFIPQSATAALSTKRVFFFFFKLVFAPGSQDERLSGSNHLLQSVCTSLSSLVPPRGGSGTCPARLCVTEQSRKFHLSGWFHGAETQ